MDLALERKEQDTVYNDVTYMGNCIKQSSELRALLRSPIIHGDKKLAIMNQLFKSTISPLTWSFVEIVIKKGREQYLVDFASCYEEMYNEMNKISHVKITTAQGIDQNTIDKIVQAMPQGKKLEIENQIDESIIGGFTLKFGDNLYDASIAKKLKDIKAPFLDESYVDKV